MARILAFLRFAKDYIKRFPGRGASLLAFLGRKLWRFWRFWLGRSKPAERPSLRTQASSYSVSGGSAVTREYVVAASYVPASTGHPCHQTHHEHSERQPGPPNTSYPLRGRSVVNRSSGSLSAVSIQSRTSDRFSIGTNPRESIRGPHDQPSQLPRGTHGRSADPCRPRERATRPSTPVPRQTTPTTRPPTPTNPHRLESITTNLPSPTHTDDKVDPVVQPSASSYTQEPLRICRGQSSTSVVAAVQFPSTESLPISASAQPQITDGPFAIDSSMDPPPDSPVVGLHDDEPGSPTSTNPPTLDYFIPDGRFVQLINSEQIPRYEKNATIPRVETAYDVKPLTTTFPYFPESDGSEQDSLQHDCTPWIAATHPDGGLYFYDEERRLFTDTDMHNKTMRDEIEEFYNYLQRLIHNDQLTIPSKNYDLVLDIMEINDERVAWSYYYACHEVRCLFWLETYDASFVMSEVYGVKSPAHVRHRFESLYWSHWSLFPVVFGRRRLPHDVYDELMGILMHGCVDVITSKSSTLPYDDDGMRRMIGLVQTAKDAKGSFAHYAAGTTRLLSFFAHWRPKRERSLLITLLSPLLFLAPEEHLRKMELSWTDEVIIESVWKSLMTTLLTEWHDVVLWSTVMLTANVGFLAIPGVVLSNLSGTDITSAKQVVIFTSPSQIASSLSIEASIGSIVIGLILITHNRSRPKVDPAGASTYLFQSSDRIFGLEPMAIVFSLPWALLMWSMVIFFVALLLFCFSISNVSTRIFVAIMSALVITLIGWCIRITWESTENTEIWPITVAVFRRTRGFLFEHVRGCNSFHTSRVPERDNIPLTYQQGDVGV